MILPETLLQDFRYGARILYRNAGFTAVAVLALALGIGVNTAVFTAYKAMVARSLDARDPGRMVNLALIRGSGVTDFSFSYPGYEAYRDSMHSFSGLIAFSPEHMRLSDAGGMISQRTSATDSLVGRLGLLSGGASNAEFAFTFVVSENYFQVLGVAPLRGRTFDSITIPRACGLALGSHQRKLLAEAVCKGSGGPWKNHPSQWRRRSNNRNHPSRFRRYQRRRA